MAVLPSDTYIADAARYRQLVRAALDLARAPGNLVVLGIPPTRPETGYGYIEARLAHGARSRRPRPRGSAIHRKTGAAGRTQIRRIREVFLECRNVFLARLHVSWIACTAFFPPRTPRSCVWPKPSARDNTPRPCAAFIPPSKIFPWTTPSWSPPLAPSGAARVSVLPAKVGWSDIGSWAAVYDLLAAKPGANVSAGASFTLDAAGNYFWAPGKFVAAIGVQDLVLVETDDALLLCPRDRAQDVGKIVKWLEQQKLARLL